MDKIEKMWSDAHKAKGKVSSYIRRAKIINPIIYGVYSIFGLGYLAYVFYDLFAAQNSIPDWLPFGWLHTFINKFSYPLLTGSLLLVAVPALLGVLLKILVHLPKNTDIPQMPDKLYLIRKNILDIIAENNALRNSIKRPLYLSIILTAITIGLAVMYGVKTNKWLDSALYALLCGAVFFTSYFVTVHVGSEKGGSEKRAIQHKAELNSKTLVVQTCVALLNDDKFTETIEIAENYNYLYGNRGDTYLLLVVARGMVDLKAAAKAVREVKGKKTFEYPEVGEIAQRLMPKLMEKAIIHYAESEKEADLCLANKDWAGVKSALAESYLSSGNCRIKYTYAALMDDADLSFDDVKWYSNCLDNAEDEGFSSDCEDMLFVCRNEIYKWAAAYNTVFTQKATAATSAASTKHMNIHDARARLKQIIADPNLTITEKEAIVKAHNNKHLDHISIKDGRYYNFSED